MREHSALRGEGGTGLLGEREINGEAELGLGPQPHWATSAPREPELRASPHPVWPRPQQGSRPSALREKGPSRKEGPATHGCLQGALGRVLWVAQEPGSGIAAR